VMRLGASCFRRFRFGNEGKRGLAQVICFH
jgi:hypothetical protein